MNESKTNINWFPGHMAKTKREIAEKLNLVDIVYEVIDARMPLSSKIVDIDDLILNKPKVLIMTKYDLCDTVETNKFVKYYENKGYKVVTLDLIGKNQVNSLLEVTNDLMKSINTKRESKGLLARPCRVLVIGIPNVGKSTLINRLVGRKAAGVGNKPGFTKQLSWIRINKDLELLDSPGILWPKFENQEVAYTLASFLAIKEEIIDKDELASFILRKLYVLYPERLTDRYGISSIDDDLIETYDTIARKRGAIGRGGITDYEKVSNIIIQDFKNGYFGKITFDCFKEEL